MTLGRVITAALLLAAIGASAPSTRSSGRGGGGGGGERSASYSDRYGLLEERNIFVRERTSRRSNSRNNASSTQPAPRPPEEKFVLTGIVFEDEGYRAYVEDTGHFETLRLSPGDKLVRGRVAAITFDAIAYEAAAANGSAATTVPATTQRTWVEIGADLTGKSSSLLASSSSATTAPTTGPVIASEVTGLNPNDPNLTPEQRMKLRRAMELQPKKP
jgi:hypothetical protein